MMNPFDPSLVRNEIDELLGEFPWFEPDVAKNLYLRLLRTVGTIPDHYEARRYFERYAMLSNAELRYRFEQEAQNRAKRSDPDDADLPAPASPARGRRQSLDGQEPGDPAVAELLARSSGRNVHDDAEARAILAPARRARGLPDPEARVCFGGIAAS